MFNYIEQTVIMQIRRESYMTYDYSKLKGRIVEVYGNQKIFAEAMDWSERTCSLKLSNKVYWKQPEISKAAELLSIIPDDIQDYFFRYTV